MNFAQQNVVIVGAASGIGRATAELFSASDAHVCSLDRIRPPIGQSYEVDATNSDSMMQIAGEIQNQCKRIDHVVVSIGMPSGTLGYPFWNLDPALWLPVLNANLVAAVNTAHAFVPHMLPRRCGTFCFVASVAGQIGSQTDPPYSAAKAGLINFTQCAAKDLANYNIRANAVSPGMVKTPMNRKVWEAWRNQSPENKLDYDQWAEAKISLVSPLGRWQTCEDVANAIVFLASDAAKNITGQTINVDGGQVMHS